MPMTPGDALFGALVGKEHSHIRGLAFLATATHILSKFYDVGPPIAHWVIFCLGLLVASVTGLESFPDHAILLPGRSAPLATWTIWCARLLMLGGPAVEALQVAQRASQSIDDRVAFCVHALNFVIGMLATELVSCRYVSAWQALRGYVATAGGLTLASTALVVGLGGSEYPAPGGTSRSAGVSLGCAIAALLFASLTTPSAREWCRRRSEHPVLNRRKDWYRWPSLPSPPPSPSPPSVRTESITNDAANATAKAAAVAGPSGAPPTPSQATLLAAEASDCFETEHRPRLAAGLAKRAGQMWDRLVMPPPPTLGHLQLSASAAGFCGVEDFSGGSMEIDDLFSPRRGSKRAVTGDTLSSVGDATSSLGDETSAPKADAALLDYMYAEEDLEDDWLRPLLRAHPEDPSLEALFCGE